MNHLTILTLITLLLLPINATARMSAVMVGGGVSGAATPSYDCVDATHDSGNNVVIACEDFQGSVDCDAGAGTQEYCRASYTLVSTPDFSTTGIESTNSVFIDASSATQGFYKSVTSGAAYYYFAKIKVVALPATSYKVIVDFNSAGTSKGTVAIQSDGTVKIAHGTISVATSGTLTAGNTYYLWTGYTAGTGADGTLYAGFSGDMTKPSICTPSGTPCGDAVSASIDTGDANSNVSRIYTMAGGASALQTIVDHIRIKTSDFGSNVP